MMEVHDTVEWDKVLPYYLDVGSKYLKHVNCEACGKNLEHGHLRAHIKAELSTNHCN